MPTRTPKRALDRRVRPLVKRARTLARSASPRSAMRRIEHELPPDLRHYARRVRYGLAQLERQIELAGRDARKRFTRLLREASHQLGGVEAEGERLWRKRTARARHEAVRMLQRLERAIEPSQPRRRPKPQRRRAARTAAAAHAAAAGSQA